MQLAAGDEGVEVGGRSAWSSEPKKSTISCRWCCHARWLMFTHADWLMASLELVLCARGLISMGMASQRCGRGAAGALALLAAV